MPPTLPDGTSLDVTIVIPQYNEVDLTIQAIESLRTHETGLWPILVVDNGSSSQSLRRLNALRAPRVFIRSLPRAGLTAAWNFATQHTSTRLIVFLNNDILANGPWVDQLIAPIQRGHSPVAAVSIRRECQLTPSAELPAGWCFGVDRRAFETVGGFDESLALYFSDTDFFLRVRQAFPERPWTLVPDLPLTHLAHRTSHRLPNRSQTWLADRERFRARWERGSRDDA